MSAAEQTAVQSGQTDHMEHLANLAERATSIAFQLKNGGWIRMKLSQERRAEVAKALRGKQ